MKSFSEMSKWYFNGDAIVEPRNQKWGSTDNQDWYYTSWTSESKLCNLIWKWTSVAKQLRWSKCDSTLKLSGWGAENSESQLCACTRAEWSRASVVERLVRLQRCSSTSSHSIYNYKLRLTPLWALPSTVLMHQQTCLESRYLSEDQIIEEQLSLSCSSLMWIYQVKLRTCEKDDLAVPAPIDWVLHVPILSKFGAHASTQNSSEAKSEMRIIRFGAAAQLRNWQRRWKSSLYKEKAFEIRLT